MRNKDIAKWEKRRRSDVKSPNNDAIKPKMVGLFPFLITTFFIISVIVSLISPPKVTNPKYINNIEKEKKLISNLRNESYFKAKKFSDSLTKITDDTIDKANKKRLTTLAMLRNNQNDSIQNIYDMQENALIAKLASNLNYSTIDAFIASYKNTILGWVGNSKDLSNTYYLGEMRTPFIYFFIKFGSILPYLFLIVTIYSSIKTIEVIIKS
tara:strand:+ start:681 stop:1313 length:633 start_codon:yes stop_codon:yes gene_type:complete